MEDFRGTEQIRTAVGGFADLSLATRPRYHQDFTPIAIGIRFSVLDLSARGNHLWRI